MDTPAAFEPRGRWPRRGRGAIRFWTVRQARFFERTYALLAAALHAIGPVVKRVGPKRAEPPVKLVETAVKSMLFDCRMCGQCILSSTGMSCPMNCPKNLRNGPCGGVRADGNCEVYPDMPCVWVEAWDGSRRMAGGDKIRDLQPAIDHRLKGTSSWIGVATGKHAEG